MPVTDLATLAQTKSWLTNAPASADDALLGALITSASGSILSYLQRQPPGIVQSFTDTFDGYGERKKMLRRWPVISVSSLTIGGTTVTASLTTPGSGYNCGYVLAPWDGMLPGRPQMLELRGWHYCSGSLNVVIGYKAGYQAQAEAQTVPAGGGTVTPNQYNGPWSQDGGVTYAVGGAALTKVTGVPATGQYSISAAGVYTFAAGDQNLGVLVTYSYVPSPLNQACMELVGEAYRYRPRQGQRSHTTPGPQTTAFDLTRLTPAIKLMIDPYRAVVPIM